jgi:hypothetical protein
LFPQIMPVLARELLPALCFVLAYRSISMNHEKLQTPTRSSA